MILVLAYWIYLLAVTSIAGITISKRLKIKGIHPVLTIFIGSFGITLFASFWSIFGNLGGYFEGALIGLCIASLAFFKRDFSVFLISLKAKISSFSTLPKVLFFAVLFMATAKCASVPYLIDNESYYIQSIKWLDTYGFVPGLGNLHPFLAQTSGWHILQSATNLDMLFPYFNDISGFFLVLGNLYAFDALSQWLKTKNNSYLIAGLFPVFNVLLFQFISAPSPDMGLYVLFLVLFFEFWKKYGDTTEDNSIIITLSIVSIFAVYIKVTAVVFMIFPLLLLWQGKKVFIKSTQAIVSIAIIAFIAFLLKNTIISGYPLYPVNLHLPIALDWKMDQEIQHYIVASTKHYAFFLTESQYQAMSSIDVFKHWLLLPKLHGLFNKLFIGLLLIFPLVLWKSKNRKTLFWLYLAALIQLVILASSSPQYRFFLMFIFMLLTAGTSVFLRNKVLIKTAIVLSVALIAIPLFVPLDLNRFTKNKFHLAIDTFQLENILTPAPKTQYIAATFKSFQIHETTFNTPENIDFFWATGDGPLPCVQEKQVEYFKDYFNVLPQQRGPLLEDGFYSKNVILE